MANALSMENYDDYTDEKLMSLLKQGDPAAFNCLYGRHWEALYQTAYRRLADREQCSDIVQDVFIDLWEQRSHKKIQQLEPYLHTAVRYKIYTLLAKGKKFPAFVEPFEQLLVSPFTADGPFHEQEQQRLLTAWLDTLPRKRRRIFELRYLEGMTTKEIADTLQVSQKTVQNQLKTASDSLRTVLMKTMILGMVFIP